MYCEQYIWLIEKWITATRQTIIVIPGRSIRSEFFITPN